MSKIDQISPLVGDDVFTARVIRWCKGIARRRAGLGIEYEDLLSYAMEAVWYASGRHYDDVDSMLRSAAVHFRYSVSHAYRDRSRAKRSGVVMSYGEAYSWPDVESDSLDPVFRVMISDEYRHLASKHGTCSLCGVVIEDKKQARGGVCGKCYSRNKKRETKHGRLES